MTAPTNCGEDSRTLAAEGAFRVVPERDLEINDDTRDHLRDEGLIRTVAPGDSEQAVVLTKEAATCSSPTAESRTTAIHRRSTRA